MHFVGVQATMQVSLKRLKRWYENRLEAHRGEFAVALWLANDPTACSHLVLIG